MSCTRKQPSLQHKNIPFNSELVMGLMQIEDLELLSRHGVPLVVHVSA